MKGDSFGKFLANVGKITLETADNRKVIINKNFIQTIAIRIIGIPHIGLRLRMSCIANLLDPKTGEKILDAGCGPGLYTLYMARNGTDMYGADLSREKIESAKRISRKLNIDINFSTISIKQLSYEDEMFDKLVCSEVLEHVDDDMQAMRELTRVLKSNGCFILSVPADNLFNKRNMERFGHVRAGYSIDEIKGLAKTFNMKIIKIVNIMSFFGKLAWNINHMLFFSKVLTVIFFWPLYCLTLLDQLLGINVKPINYIVKFQKNKF